MDKYKIEALQELKQEAGIIVKSIDKPSNFEILKLKNLGIFKVKPPKILKEIKLLYEAIGYDSPLSYKIYEFKFGIGQGPKFLITNPNVKINNGEGKKYIRPSTISGEDDIYNNFPSKNIVKHLAKSFLIDIKDEDSKKEKTTEELWNEILSTNSEFYKPTSPLSEDSLDKIKSSDNQTINKIIDFYLTEGNLIDQRLLLASKSHFLDYDNDLAKPEHLMPYNLHAVIVTNTKTTKSSIYEKIGEKRERMSMAGALGFSTSNESNQGDLNEVMGSYAVDEVQENRETNVIQQTLTAMETGRVAVSVGKQTVRTATCATLIFLTNPKELSDAKDYWDPKRTSIGAFRRVCEILTDNYRAFGSRIGIILFGNDFVKARGSRPDYKTHEGVKAIVDSIKQEVAPEFTKIMLNSEVHDWMNSDLPSEYTAKIKTTCKGIPIREVREVWEGHSEAFRHIRGGAVRRACLDFLLNIWNGNYDIEMILKKAEIYLNQILEINLNSLNEMAEISNNYMEGFIDNLIEKVQPDYVRHFVMILLSHIDNNPHVRENYILFEDLRDTFDRIDNRSLLFGGKYSRWNEIKGKFGSVRQAIQTKLLNDFGVQFTKIEGVSAFQIINLFKFEQFKETRLYKQLSFQSDGVSGVRSVDGVKANKNAPNAPKTPSTPQVNSDQEINQDLDESDHDGGVENESKDVGM